MSVLNCNRNGCQNIMCDFYSHTYGYLCRECKQELIESPTVRSITEFMDSPKVEEDINPYWEEEINETFVSRYEDE